MEWVKSIGKALCVQLPTALGLTANGVDQGSLFWWATIWVMGFMAVVCFKGPKC